MSQETGAACPAARRKWVQRGLVHKGGPSWGGCRVELCCFLDDLGSFWENNKLWNFLKFMTGNFRCFGDILCILLSFSIVILTTGEILPKVNIQL